MLALNRKQPCNLQAEATALKHALIWANRLKRSRIDIEGDSKTPIQIISKKAQLPWSLKTFAEDVRNWIESKQKI